MGLAGDMAFSSLNFDGLLGVGSRAAAWSALLNVTLN